MTLLILLSHQRSGSHFLKETLNCHNEYLDQVGYAGTRYIALPEVLTPGSEMEYPDQSKWLFGPFLRERVLSSPIEWGNPGGIANAATLYFRHLHDLSHDKIILADIKLNQLYIGEGWYQEPTSPPRLVYTLRSEGKIILLRRRNIVRAIVSGMQAKHTGIWHVRHGLSAPCPAKFKINVDDFRNRLIQVDSAIAQADEWLRDWDHATLKVAYEDLYDTGRLACNSQVFDRIAEFAGMAAGITWTTSMRKTGTYQLCDVIENYEEVVSGLQSTRFAEMLSDEPFSSNITSAAA